MAYRDALVNELNAPMARRRGVPGIQAPPEAMPMPGGTAGPPAPIGGSMGGMGGGIVGPPTEMPKGPSSGPVDYQSLVMGLLKDKPYGPESLAAIEGDLSQHGIQMQKDSGGRVRGRIKLPTGDIVDLPGAGEGNDWWSTPRAGGFTWTNRGQEGLDAGGWSFGGPSLSGSTGGIGLAFPDALMPTEPNPVAAGPIANGSKDENLPYGYLQALLAQLGLGD